KAAVVPHILWRYHSLRGRPIPHLPAPDGRPRKLLLRASIRVLIRDRSVTGGATADANPERLAVYNGDIRAAWPAHSASAALRPCNRTRPTRTVSPMTSSTRSSPRNGR